MPDSELGQQPGHLGHLGQVGCRCWLILSLILILSAPSLPSSSPGLPTPSRGGSKSSWWGFPVSPSFSYFPQPGGIAAQWVGCLPLPQPHLHRDNTVRLAGCRQGVLIAKISKFQMNPKTPGVRLYLYLFIFITFIRCPSTSSSFSETA